MIEASTFSEYMSTLKRNSARFLIVFCVRDTIGLKFSGDHSKCLQSLGLNKKGTLKHGRSYIAIVNKGIPVFERMSGSNETVVYQAEVGGIPLYIKSSTYGREDLAYIRISNSDNLAVNIRGLNIVVFDLLNNLLYDSVAFDFHVSYNTIFRKDDIVMREMNGLKARINEIERKNDLFQRKTEMLLWGVLRELSGDDLSARKNFFLKMPKATGMLRKIQKCNLVALSVFDQVCKRNNINYWVSFGALIGAVRHKGFIPWDDDIDVGITRDMLPKLEQAFSNNPLLEFRTFVDATGLNICYKVHYRLKGILCDIDIFVYDYCQQEDLVETMEKQDRYKKRMIAAIRKSASNDTCSIEERKVKTHKIVQDYINNSKDEFNIVDSKEANILLWGVDNTTSYQAKHSTTFLTDIFPLKSLPIEGIPFPVPRTAETYVNTLYGDAFSIPKDVFTSNHFDFSHFDEDNLDYILTEYYPFIEAGKPFPDELIIGK